jgi:hypothetical protein
MPEGKGISDKMKDLIRLLLTPNPVLRPDIEELKEILTQYKHKSF